MNVVSWTEFIFITFCMHCHDGSCFQNFALNKSANQSSTMTYNGFQWTADKAVDGNTNGANPDGSKTCSATAGPYGTQTWEIDIGFLIIVKTITVYERTDGNDQLSGFKVFMGNTSKSWTGNQPLNEAKPVQPVIGPHTFRVNDSLNRFVSVTRPNSYIMMICEVTVEGECPKGKYGDVCNETCGNCLYGNVSCNSITGQCTKGCQKGWRGETCKDGIVSTSGELWKEHRKKILTTLRNFGSGKNSLEGKIHTEVTILLSEIAKQQEHPFRIQHLVQTSVSNVINAILFGEHFKHDDPKFKKEMTLLDETLKNLGLQNLVVFFPFLRYLPGDMFHVEKTLRNVKYIEGFIGDLIDKHMENFDENKIEDFTDALLLEMKNTRDQKDSISTKKQLTKTVLNLFGAGAETTTTTIVRAILYLAAKQDIQARVFREINEIVGTNRLPSLQDKLKLVYTEAFIMEILRACNILPVTIPHTCSVDLKIHGVDIPKGTTLLPDIDSVLFDPKIWGDPEEFRPERFIGEEGNLLKPEEFIPFPTGRRNCVGESLARMELDFFIPALVQRYEFLPPEGTTLDIKEIDRVFGLTHKPKPFEIRAIVRKKEAKK